MSVIQNPLIGRAKQKLGGSVFTTWKGINVLKGKPLSVANPKTDPQLMRRSALTQIIALARTIAAALNFGFKEQAVHKSAFNAFVGYNLKNAFDYAAPPVATMLPVDILVSQGTISPTVINSMVADQSLATIVVNYPTTADLPGESASDLLYGVAMNNVTGVWITLPGSGLRSTGTKSFATPAGFVTVGQMVRGFFFFYNSSTRKSADSYHISEMPVA